jgi:hypothetical protein
MEWTGKERTSAMHTVDIVVSRTLICKSLKSNFRPLRGSFIAANFPATCNENFFLAFLVVAINLPTIVRQ